MLNRNFGTKAIQGLPYKFLAESVSFLRANYVSFKVTLKKNYSKSKVASGVTTPRTLFGFKVYWEKKMLTLQRKVGIREFFLVNVIDRILNSQNSSALQSNRKINSKKIAVLYSVRRKTLFIKKMYLSRIDKVLFLHIGH